MRALLDPTGTGPDGTESWLVIAVRHRKDVYEELQVAVNRVTGEIEFVDLAVVGDSALRRAGITLTRANSEAEEQAPSSNPRPSRSPRRCWPAYQAGLRDLGARRAARRARPRRHHQR